MSESNLTLDQKLEIGSAKRILGLLEIMLDEENMEFVIESESMFIRTKDQQNVFKLVDLDMEDDGLGRDSVIVLPRTTDAHDLIPIRLDGKDL